MQSNLCNYLLKVIMKENNSNEKTLKVHYIWDAFTLCETLGYVTEQIKKSSTL